MDLGLFLRSVVIGFSIAAPIGPIGVLCIQRTLLHGRKSGLISGLGAATADAIYGSIAGFGLTVLSDILLAWQFWLRLLGGIFLCHLGVTTVLSKLDEPTNKFSDRSQGTIYGSTFLLTLTNPLTILSFAAVFAGLGGAVVADYMYAGLFVLGIFAGSLLWWVLLTSVLGLFIHTFDAKKLLLVNQISGVVIAGFGVYFMLSLYPLF